MYVTRVCTRLTDICIQTNVRYSIRARRTHVHTYISVGRQKDQMCVGTGGRGSRRKGEDGKRRKEGGAGRRRQKNTHRRCSVRSKATGTLLSVTNFFFLFLPELLSCQIVVHGGYMLILVPRIYTGIVETNHRVCLPAYCSPKQREEKKPERVRQRRLSDNKGGHGATHISYV